MNNYIKPEIIVNDEMAEGVYAASGADCLNVTAWNDGTDGTNIYRVVFKLTHTGHQSYGQTIQAMMSTNVTVVETPGDVTATASGNVLTVVRNNQLNDTGLTEIWVKLSASVEPTVVKATASDCVR